MINAQSQHYLPNRIGRFFCFLFLFMLLSGPRLNFPDLNIFFSVLLSIGCFVFFIFRPYIERALGMIMMICAFSLLYAVFVVVINDYVELSIIVDAVRLNIWFYASVAIFLLYRRFYSSIIGMTIITHIQIVYIFNAFFVLMVMLVPDVKNFALNHLSNNQNMESLVVRSIRSTDLIMGGGAVTSVVFSVVFILSLVKFYIKYDRISFISMVLCLTSIIFTGRTGGVLIILTIFPILLYVNFMISGRFKILNSIFYIIVSVFLLCGLLYLFFWLMLSFNPELTMLIYEKSLTWGLELFFNLFSSTGFSTESTSELKNMYLSVNLLDVFSFLGTSYSGRNEQVYYLYTDVGYFRALFSVGFLGFLIIISKYIYIFFVVKKIGSFYDESQLILKVTVMYYLFAIFVTNFKEYHEAVRSGFPLLLIMFFFLYSSSRIRASA